MLKPSSDHVPSSLTARGGSHLTPSEYQSPFSGSKAPKIWPLSPTCSLSTLIFLMVLEPTQPGPTSESLACFPLCPEGSSPTYLCNLPLTSLEVAPIMLYVYLCVFFLPQEHGSLLGQGLYCRCHCGGPEGQPGAPGRESPGGEHSEVRLFPYPLPAAGPASDSVLSPPPPGRATPRLCYLVQTFAFGKSLLINEKVRVDR